ncbi:MAG: hypothetical protein J7493_08040 [Porphyrobacter sp.]|nr:hypothetical protein [Porphyrobacter sp.]
MIPILFSPAVILLAAEVHGAGQPNANTVQQPREITEFFDRRAACQHFLGEEPYDRECAAELAKAVRKLRCDHLSRDEKRLRRSYRSDPAIQRVLNETPDSL